MKITWTFLQQSWTISITTLNNPLQSEKLDRPTKKTKQHLFTHKKHLKLFQTPKRLKNKTKNSKILIQPKTTSKSQQLQTIWNKLENDQQPKAILTRKKTTANHLKHSKSTKDEGRQTNTHPKKNQNKRKQPQTRGNNQERQCVSNFNHYERTKVRWNNQKNTSSRSSWTLKNVGKTQKPKATKSTYNKLKPEQPAKTT